MTGRLGAPSHAALRMPAGDIALALLASCMWGVNNIVAKVVVAHVPPLAAVGVRFFLAGLLLVPLMRIPPGKLKPLVICALIAGPLHFGLLYTGFAAAERIGPVATVTQLWIPFSTLLAIPLLGERPRIWTISGLAIAFAGVLVMGFDPGLFNDLDGFLFVAAAAACWATSSVLARKFGGIPGFVLQAWLANVSWPLLLMGSVATEHGQWTAIGHWGWAFWVLSLASAVTASIIGNGLIFSLIGRHPVALVTPYTLVAPPVTLVLGVLILDEALSTRAVLGSLITLAGLVIITLRQRQRVLKAFEQPAADRA